MNSDPRTSAGYIPWWLLAVVAGIFLVTALALWIFVLATRTADLPAPTATAMVVTAAPAPGAATATRQSPPTPAPSSEPSVTPPAPPPGEVKVGVYVQITGTQPEGTLNLRAEPNIKSPVQYLALEREVLQVQAGPADGDGYVWWYLVDPATSSKYGWGVQNYLLVVPGP
jgi:type IV secretory pathway VirB10-like protein